MIAPDKHKYEEERVLKLQQYQILETEANKDLDDVVKIASQICDVPIAFISFVNTDKQHLKSTIGIEACQSSRDDSICGHTILEENGYLEIEDTLKDERFSKNPFVCASPKIRYYFGASLISPDGYPIGTICAVDRRPRKLSAIQRESMLALARQIISFLELHLMNDGLINVIKQVKTEILARLEKEKQLQEALEESKKIREELANLSLVAKETDNSVIITDAEGITEYVNEGFTQLTGYKPSDIIGKEPGDILQGKETTKEQIESFKKGLESREPFIQRIINYTKSGQKYWVLCAITPVFNEEDELIKFISIERDITDEKEKENALVEAKKEAEEGIRIKDQFLSNMSHEIRTPMNGIIGLTNLLKEENLNDYQHHLVETIDLSANMLLRIINDILDLSKINAEKLTFEHIDFNLKDILNNLHNTFGPMAKEKGLNFSIMTASSTPDWVNGDPTRVSQVLMNLINNALKFTEFGSVSVEVRLKKSSNNKHIIQFDVKDTGIGIAQEKVDSIFDEFTQANDDISRKFGGTGLGLSIAKRLVERMNGTLSLTSKPQQGTTFTFDLEFEIAKQPEQQVPNNLKLKPTNDSPLRILLVEDNEINQLVATKVLEKMGHEVVTADDGQQALDLHVDKDFDLILMDVHMPNMNGLDATKIIRRMNDPIKSNIIILAMTASVLPTDINNCEEAGMNGHISKPFKTKDLKEKLLEIYQQKEKIIMSA